MEFSRENLPTIGRLYSHWSWGWCGKFPYKEENITSVSCKQVNSYYSVHIVFTLTLSKVAGWPYFSYCESQLFCFAPGTLTCHNVIVNNTLIYSQKYLSLNNSFYGHHCLRYCLYSQIRMDLWSAWNVNGSIWLVEEALMRNDPIFRNYFLMVRE